MSEFEEETRAFVDLLRKIAKSRQAPRRALSDVGRIARLGMVEVTLLGKQNQMLARQRRLSKKVNFDPEEQYLWVQQWSDMKRGKKISSVY
ncbi:hypothetical protein ACVI1L_004908 [Bradyrhizobium sp. USDA 4516]